VYYIGFAEKIICFHVPTAHPHQKAKFIVSEYIYLIRTLNTFRPVKLSCIYFGQNKIFSPH
jgi:hypothetical protein